MKLSSRTKNSAVHFQKIASPIGALYLVADDEALLAVVFEDTWKKPAGWREASSKITKLAAKQLSQYFRGERTSFEIPYRLEGTEFQVKVWKTLGKIPYAKTWSYKKQATTMGRPTAVRAVGGTNGKNPLAIVLPCHRVIGSSGKLTGYAAGLDKKTYLLALELKNSTISSS